jgi:Fe-S-cluster containining protein
MKPFQIDFSNNSYLAKLLRLLEDCPETSRKYHDLFLNLLEGIRKDGVKNFKSLPCQHCDAECCKGEGIEGIPLYLSDVAHFLDHGLEDYFVVRPGNKSSFLYSGLFTLKTPSKGYCDFVDPKTFMCRLQFMKPMYCIAWPFQYGISFKQLEANHCHDSQEGG